MMRMFIVPGSESGKERIIVDVTGRWMSLKDERKLRKAILDTNLVEPSDCASEHFNGNGLADKHYVTVGYNDAFSVEKKLELAGVIRDTIAGIMSEVTVVNCTGLQQLAPGAQLRPH